MHKYTETVLFLYLNLFDACDQYQTFSLCAYFWSISVWIYIKVIFWFSGSKWWNIFYQYDGNCVLKKYIIFVTL